MDRPGSTVSVPTIAVTELSPTPCSRSCLLNLRPLTPTDHERVLALNNSAVPAVNELDGAALDQLAQWAELALVVVDDRDEIGGFLLCLPGPGAPYGSANYRWFSDRYQSFLYVDRVVVDPAVKGGGVGRRLYRAAVDHGTGRFEHFTAEVNLRPRNVESLRFHERLGFERVGEADTEGGEKRVVYLRRSLSSDAPAG